MRLRLAPHLVVEGTAFVQERFRLVCWENEQRKRRPSLLGAVLHIFIAWLQIRLSVLLVLLLFCW